jgi:hypothetical protein
LVSDQSAYCQCEKFLFTPDGIDRIPTLGVPDADLMFPKHDILFIVLRDWLKDLFRNPFDIPIFIIDKAFLRIGMDSSEFMKQVAQDLDTMFFI